jgi:hypothetical protein
MRSSRQTRTQHQSETCDVHPYKFIWFDWELGHKGCHKGYSITLWQAALHVPLDVSKSYSNHRRHVH